ncbi:hypothetical protein KR222_002699 [Zaprionus bogoriensis]|nr:hypothetical protein KR222_002699 [Zaprionus bogoriensis]
MGENVKVIVRCRPMNQKEIINKCNNIIEISNYAVSIVNPLAQSAPKKSFTFDSAYDAFSKTETIYNDMCYSLVESTLEGYNGTIFAYGQTGCGKTHTMQDGSFENKSYNGIIPRCFDHIFETISISSSMKYLALVSYLEIYNENIRDLLCDNGSVGYMQSHILKDVPGVGITVPSLSSKPVMNAKECYNWLKLGNNNRITGATLMNDQSSRSHTIFTISLEHIQDTGLPSSSSIMGGIRRGKLNLVDLAGSERLSKTGAIGERLKEATKINLSLSALGNVISALVDGKTKYVPYRDSKLTRLLQDSLGGNTKTIMISCISPADTNYDETLSTLRYANRAKNISNKPMINEDPKDAQLRQYQQEIIELKRMLDMSQHQEGLLQQEQEKLLLEGEKEKLRQEIMDNLSKSNQETAETKLTQSAVIQLQARKKIDIIKHALIGGEKVNDMQLRENHRLRKLKAERHLSAIAHALSRVESEDRDLLKDHYASIQQEIYIKNERIKMCTQKIKMLEREVDDLNSEFQLDREDYLDEIRKTQRQLKFYQLLLQKAQPILQKHKRYW